jgi:alanine racemase
VISEPALADADGADAVLTIDLAALAGNYRQLAARAEGAACAAVVKADAYGLGMAAAAPALWQAGARTFFVAQLAEAVPLRALLPEAEIGVLNGLALHDTAPFADHQLLPVLNSLGEIERWGRACTAREARLPAFLQIDTGMSRLGLPPDELGQLIARPDLLRPFPIRAVMSHLACADEAGHPKTAAQLALFRTLLAKLPPAPASLANSSGIHRGRDYHFDMVRPGCALYGVNPTPEADNPMRQVARLDSRVIQVRRVDSPATVGYGATHRFRGSAKIATIPVGYADGYQRVLGGRGQVSVAGATVPVVGRISMDLITIDVSALPEGAVEVGTPVRLLGAPGPSVNALAAAAGTIGYEILTGLGHRFARRYHGAGA